jgi:methyl-accepting chemotaxis protein
MKNELETLIAEYDNMLPGDECNKKRYQIVNLIKNIKKKIKYVNNLMDNGHVDVDSNINIQQITNIIEESNEIVNDANNTDRNIDTLISLYYKLLFNITKLEKFKEQQSCNIVEYK